MLLWPPTEFKPLRGSNTATGRLIAFDCSLRIGINVLGHDQSVAETLVVTFQMMHGLAQRAFTKEDHLIQAGFLDAPDEPFGIRV